MHRAEWTDLDVFREVYDAGSMLDAAVVLKCNPSTVSRRIAALEASLGGRLFERGPGRWATTALAERIVPLAHQMGEAAQRIEQAARDEADALAGTITVTAGDAMMRGLLLPVLSAFRNAHPGIRLTLISDDERMDLGAREADVAVRCTPKPPSDLVGRNLGQATARVYGVPELVASAERGGETSCLTWIGDGVVVPDWIDEIKIDTRHLIRVNSVGLMLDAARAGMGLALLPCMLADRVPELRRFPTNFSDPGWSIWVLSHADVRNTARVRAVRDALVDWLRENADLISGEAPIAAE
ncbi:LysR family transcriptional regulator [Litoreibacter roseus]|uniref:LysR family transcriptional regulator n=1 Tax=Litoreibacter roseus TaxID=2601869 RepID=A0A6N6JJV3_9RHOB|nr:LysR family transcriptional regulator [Litoreibacter roseus]GFE65719.1 LysR family transcriptional regulator [Litoreibacter roseus]